MPNKFLPPQTDTATRTASTPIQGEILYDINENQLYYGDGATTGGVVVSKILTTPPATASSTGIAGQIAYDASYIYICTATDTWLRASIATW